MQLGMIGLGRMGANMVRRLLRGGHQCVVFDMNPTAVQALVAPGPAVETAPERVRRAGRRERRSDRGQRDKHADQENGPRARPPT